ncbi:MAG: hypothetical protein M1114_02055 [Candidatus Dependentiae bacterium]|nr:hypothetical protein [Candidatus Dependentiae bacterium]
MQKISFVYIALLIPSLIIGMDSSEDKSLTHAIKDLMCPENKAKAIARELQMARDGYGDDYAAQALEICFIAIKDNNVEARREALRLSHQLLQDGIYKYLGILGQTLIRIGERDNDSNVKELASQLKELEAKAFERFKTEKK